MNREKDFVRFFCFTKHQVKSISCDKEVLRNDQRVALTICSENKHISYSISTAKQHFWLDQPIRVLHCLSAQVISHNGKLRFLDSEGERNRPRISDAHNSNFLVNSLQQTPQNGSVSVSPRHAVFRSFGDDLG